jgi:hypothetical protein
LFLKIQKIIKRLKTWTISIESFITGRNRKNQGIKKEMKPSKYKTSEKM